MGESPELSKLYTFHMFVREDNTWKGIRIVQAARAFSICSGKNMLNIKKKEKTSPVSDLGTVWFRTAVTVCCLSGHQSSVLGDCLCHFSLEEGFWKPLSFLIRKREGCRKKKVCRQKPLHSFGVKDKEISYWRYPWLALWFGKRKIDLCIQQNCIGFFSLSF